MRMMWIPLNMEIAEEDATEASEAVHHNLKVVDVGDTITTKLTMAQDVSKILLILSK